MSRIIIDRLSDRAWEALKKSAQANHRDVQEEAAEWLERAVPVDQPQSIGEELARIRQTRQQLADAGVWLTQERIEEILKEGRE